MFSWGKCIVFFAYFLSVFLSLLSRSLENAKSSEGNVLKSREAYRILAVRAAVIYRLEHC